MRYLKLTLFLLAAIFFVKFSALAKISDPEYEKNIREFPVYPQARVYEVKNNKIRMKVHLSEAGFEKVSSFYIDRLKQKGWKIVFPDPEELKIWMQALYSDKSKTPNIVLELTKPKSKFNCNITIGVVKDARSPVDLTIITIYLTDVMLK